MIMLTRFAAAGLLIVASSGALFPRASEAKVRFAPQQESLPPREDPDHPFQEGLTALKENRFQDALEALTKAEHLNPSDARIRNFRGIVLARLGQTAESRAEYREAIRCNPAMEDAYRNLGFLEWTEHRLPEAREALQLALKLAPGDSFARHYLGRVQLDDQHYADAFRELGQSTVPWPDEPGFLLQVTRGYIELGRQEEARKSLRQLDLRSLGEFQSAQAATLFVAVRENDRAANLLRQAAERSPVRDSWAHFDLALLNLVSGKYQEAIEQARSYIEPQTKKRKPEELAAAWSLTGIARARLGEGERAVDDLRLAASADPKNEEGWLNLSRELMELNRFAEAISAVQEGISVLPRSYALQLRLGAAYLRAGRYEKAEEVFRGLVAAGDPLSTSYVGLAQVLLRQGRAEEAVSELASAQKRIGPDFLLSYFEGLSFERTGNESEALAAYQEAAHLNPGSAEAHFGSGKMLLALGRSNEAVAELEETLRLSPGYSQALRLLPQAYRRAKQVDGESKPESAHSNASPEDQKNLIGDFLLPSWKMPPEEKNPPGS